MVVASVLKGLIKICPIGPSVLQYATLFLKNVFLIFHGCLHSYLFLHKIYAVAPKGTLNVLWPYNTSCLCYFISTNGSSSISRYPKQNIVKFFSGKNITQGRRTYIHVQVDRNRQIDRLIDR